MGTVLSGKAKQLHARITRDDCKLGDLRKLALEIKKDHGLATELWATGDFHPRMLAILIMDRSQLTEESVEQLAVEIQTHEPEQGDQLADWLLANQLTKTKRTTGMIESWKDHPSPSLRRIYWTYQGRLRWAGKTPPGNAAELLDDIEKDLAKAEPEVQWAMNFAAAQIGINEPAFRARCNKLGETVGLYRDDPVPRGCTPRYLPRWIEVEVEKLGK